MKLFYKTSVVFTQQKKSSGKCLQCISRKQCIDNMYTQVVIHAAAIGSLAVSQFLPLLLLTLTIGLLSLSLLLDCFNFSTASFL